MFPACRLNFAEVGGITHTHTHTHNVEQACRPTEGKYVIKGGHCNTD